MKNLSFLRVPPSYFANGLIQSQVVLQFKCPGECFLPRVKMPGGEPFTPPGVFTRGSSQFSLDPGEKKASPESDWPGEQVARRMSLKPGGEKALPRAFLLGGVNRLGGVMTPPSKNARGRTISPPSLTPPG